MAIDRPSRMSSLRPYRLFRPPNGSHGQLHREVRRRSVIQPVPCTGQMYASLKPRIERISDGPWIVDRSRRYPARKLSTVAFCFRAGCVDYNDLIPRNAHANSSHPGDDAASSAAGPKPRRTNFSVKLGGAPPAIKRICLPRGDNICVATPQTAGASIVAKRSVRRRRLTDRSDQCTAPMCRRCCSKTTV